MKLKKIIISSIAFCSLMTIGKVSASIDESKLSSYFPDEALNLCVVKAYNSAGLSDANYDYEIEDNLSKITTIECSQRGVTNTKGIGYLTGLKSLNMSRNDISTIDLSKNTELEILDLSDNKLKTLELEKNSKLRSVNLNYNSLSYVRLGNKYELTNLNLSNNMLEVINLSSATSLSDLDLHYNSISSIDVSKNIALTSLDLNNNNISTIDLSKNTALEYLYLKDNGLTKIDVSKNVALKYLSLINNKLSTIDVSKNIALKTLYLTTNNISAIDVSKNTALTMLSLSSNKLTAVDLSKNTKLTELYLKDNNFSQPTGTKYGLGKLTVGEKVSFKEYVKLPQGFKTKVSYTSSNPEIATVDENGNINGVKEGTVTITLTSKDKNGNLIYEVNEVTVTKKVISVSTTEKTNNDKTKVKNPETSDKGMIYGGGLTLTIGTIIAIRKKLKLLGI